MKNLSKLTALFLMLLLNALPGHVMAADDGDEQTTTAPAPAGEAEPECD